MVGTSAYIKVLFVSLYPTDPEKGPTQKNLFLFSSKNYFFKISLQTFKRELFNVNSVIFKKYSKQIVCVFSFIAYSRTKQ